MFNKVSVAIAAALFSSTAFAIAPNVAPDIEIFMSGASAQDNGIAALFTDLCVAGTTDVYKDGVVPAPTGSSHFAYYCTMDVTQVTDGSGVGAGMQDWIAAHPGVNPNVLFHKRAAGGSAQGVNPVIDETAIAHMVINNGNCTETAAGSRLWACNITNAGNTVNVVSDAGVSDVNPEMFVGDNVPAGFGPINASVVAAKMTVVPGAALVFGIPVSLPMYNALQLAQGKTVGAIDEANMPSLSKAEVASIMAGKVKNWNQFKAGPAGQGLRDYVVALGGVAPSSNLVNICRRVNGSGTQAQMNAKFMNYPCTAGALAPTVTSNTFTGPVVTLNSSSGNVDTCLNTAATNNRWAVGLQALEKNFLVGGAYPLAYRFVKIDGVAR
ncbi:MAG: hypothetical protein HYZ31_04835, partial [Gammaproteobacteria bacterium]|nr:hypothetical protein [Gammaproteobacteria bacterium]